VVRRLGVWFVRFFWGVLTSDRCSDAAAGRESADDAAANWPACRHKIIEHTINKRFIKHALVAVALEIELERFQLHAQRARRVGEGERAEIGLAGLGTETGEFGTNDFDCIVASGLGIGESFQLLGGRRINSRHDFTSIVAESQRKNPAVFVEHGGVYFVKSASNLSKDANMFGCRPSRERRSGESNP